MADKAKALSPDEARDKQRHDDREAELERQKEVDDAMEKFLAENEAEARQRLEEQREYETTGIRKVNNA